MPLSLEIRACACAVLLGTVACAAGDRAPAAQAARPPATTGTAGPAAAPATEPADSAPSVEPAPGPDTSEPAPLAGPLPGSDQAPPPPVVSTSAVQVPLVTGLRIVSTLVFPDGDRDNVVVTSVSDEGVTYAWRLRQEQGGKTQEFSLKRFVSASDLAGAPRLNDVVGTEGPDETPGYTFVSLSRATYGRLRATGEAPFTVTGMDAGLLGGAFGGLGASRVTYKGGFSLVSPAPVPIPVLLDGQRTTLPALHLKGKFAFQDTHQDGEYWVLADSVHPLILKEVNGKDLLQVVRIDRPVTAGSMVEAELAKDCRAELPGIYFGFASAALDPASAPALETVAAMLKRHADWTLGIEGHTDSVGGPASNQRLSEQRAEAVRSALVSRLGVPAARLTAAGYGATRPRESNASVEGRARNRRVELVRPCAGKTAGPVGP